MLLEGAPEIRSLRQGQDGVYPLGIETGGAFSLGEDLCRCRTCKSIHQIKHLCEMQDAGRPGDARPLEPISHALAIPPFPLKTQRQLDGIGQTQLPRKQFCHFTVAAHRFLDDRSALHQEGCEFGNAAGEVGVQPQVFR